MPLAQVSFREVDQFVASQHQHARSWATSNRRLNALKHFFDFCLDQQFVGGNPVKPSHFVRRGRPLPKALSREHLDALIVFSEPLANAHQRRSVDFATQHRLPMISEIKEFAEAGSLMTYGPSLPDLFRRAVYYVDRLLKGTKPANLPVEQPMRWYVVVNLKAAEALGLTISPFFLYRADQLIR